MGVVESKGATERRWATRVVEVLQPVNVRAGRLGSTALFAGLPWRELECAASAFHETLVERGSRMTVQGQPSPRLWLILEGEALISADARPLRVAGPGDVVGLAGMLYALGSPETAIALSPIRAFETDLAGLTQLMLRPALQRRLDAARFSLGSHRRVAPTRRRSSRAG